MKKEKEKTELEKKLEKEIAAEAETAPPEAEPPHAQLPDIVALVAERDSVRDQLLRTLADFDNYRKRLAREHERNRKLAAESVLRDLLPVLDNLERAVDHADADPDALVEGVKMVLGQFRAVLERHGLKQIPALNEPFDPHVHEAVMQAESDEIPPDHVVQEFEKGYKLGDFVLRPSKVVVSRASLEPAPAAAQAGEEVTEPADVDSAQKSDTD
ncbi:MAG: nucleotide exchange factor GrpE [Candidatus Hydrogenedentes bacterium]|nr:nucleotide exchange factor GrpE [Candidatus Hydrogenedentota bacterium]